MSAPVVQTQSKTGKGYQKSLELKEGFEMKTATGIEKSKVWISENLGTKMATRLFRGLALGVLLAAATGLYFSINQGEAGSPSSGSEITQAFEVEELEAPVIGVPAYSNGEINQAFQAPAYWVQRDESEEMLFDEVRQAFIGIPSSGSEVTQAVEVEELEAPVIGVPAYSNGEINQAFQAQAYWVQRDEAAEVLFDELRQAWTGIDSSMSRGEAGSLPT
jgi:phage head maturation protease